MEERGALMDWVEDQGGLHILVNNAGTNRSRPAVEYGEDEWRQIFETNLFSAFELSRMAHPLIRPRWYYREYAHSGRV